MSQKYVHFYCSDPLIVHKISRKGSLPPIISEKINFE